MQNIVQRSKSMSASELLRKTLLCRNIVLSRYEYDLATLF